MKKNILSVIGAATVAAVALKLTTKYVKNEVIKELEDDGYLMMTTIVMTVMSAAIVMSASMIFITRPWLPFMSSA